MVGSTEVTYELTSNLGVDMENRFRASKQASHRYLRWHRSSRSKTNDQQSSTICDNDLRKTATLSAESRTLGHDIMDSELRWKAWLSGIPAGQVSVRSLSQCQI